MKVERQDPEKRPFIPIVVTLETREEATYLWHRLNCAGATSFVQYCQKEGILLNRGACTLMWHTLDEVFTPEEEC